LLALLKAGLTIIINKKIGKKESGNADDELIVCQAELIVRFQAIYGN